MTLRDFKNILLTVLPNVYHFEAYKEEGDEYIVWQETGGHSSYGENRRASPVQHVQVELYTKREFTETLDRLLSALDTDGIAVEEPIPDFDPDTKRTRYIIECEAV